MNRNRSYEARMAQQLSYISHKAGNQKLIQCYANSKLNANSTLNLTKTVWGV